MVRTVISESSSSISQGTGWSCVPSSPGESKPDTPRLISATALNWNVKNKRYGFEKGVGVACRRNNLGGCFRLASPGFHKSVTSGLLTTYDTWLLTRLRRRGSLYSTIRQRTLGPPTDEFSSLVFLASHLAVTQNPKTYILYFQYISSKTFLHVSTPKSPPIWFWRGKGDGGRGLVYFVPACSSCTSSLSVKKTL